VPLWSAALGLVALATTWAAQPIGTGEPAWQPIGEGVVTNDTHLVGEVETTPVEDRVRVRGWIVDVFSATRPDLVEIEDLAGKRLGEVSSGGFERRRDVELRFGSSAYSLSGFDLLISNPPKTLVVKAHVGQLGWWQTSVAGPSTRRAQVTRLACTTAADVEIEVTSAEPFPVRNALTELQIGDVITSLSRYADDGDLHTLVFRLSRDQFLAISTDDNAFVRYNPSNGDDVWLIGPIDPAAAMGCAEVDEIRQTPDESAGAG
jgi:hypothetical protein